jgi:pSer/pThr/pTyr-binding forkhead associated (FHA) protein
VVVNAPGLTPHGARRRLRLRGADRNRCTRVDRLAVLVIADSERVLLTEGVNEIGRSRESTVWLEGAQVSRHHARITVRHGTALIEDLGSTNRTRVNDAPLAGPTPLADGDSIQIGRAFLIFRVSESS